MSSPTGANITCYNYDYATDGQSFSDNAKCPDSDSCCGATDTCLSSRLCKKTTGVIVRPSCANYPWTLSSCAQICLYDNAAGYVPRVNICPDGSYCCDNDPSCCADKTGAILNNDGVLIGFANQTTSSSMSSSTSSLKSSATSLSASTTPVNAAGATSSSASTSSTATATATLTTDNSNSGLSTGAEAGIGVGVALAVLILLGLALLFFFRRRRNARQGDHIPLPQYPYEDAKPGGDYYASGQQSYPVYAKTAPNDAVYDYPPQVKPSELEGQGVQELE